MDLDIGMGMDMGMATGTGMGTDPETGSYVGDAGGSREMMM